MKVDIYKLFRTVMRFFILYSVLCIIAFSFIILCTASDSFPVFNNNNVNNLELYKTEAEPKTGSWGGVEFTIDIPEHKSIDDWIHYYTTRGKNSLLATLNRSLIYTDFILKKLEEKNMPRELLFIPIIESAFSNSAVSRAGATGLWQLMKATGDQYGLEINSWVDGRKDFWRCTDAALNKLSKDYEYFGDWFLTIAAYNFGRRGVSTVVKNTGINDFFELLDEGYLPEETRRYVPKFLAVMQVCTRPAKYGLDISGLGSSMSWDRVKVRGMVDLEIISYLSGIPLEWLKIGNAELKQMHTPPYANEYWIKIPEMYSSRLREVINENKFNLSEVGIHTIEPGDTVYSISNRYRVNTYLISRVNPDVDIFSLEPGDVLNIPIAKLVLNSN